MNLNLLAVINPISSNIKLNKAEHPKYHLSNFFYFSASDLIQLESSLQ